MSLQAPAKRNGLTLLTFSSSTASGQYTLPRVPADRTGTPTGATYETVRAAQISDRGEAPDGSGDSIAEGVQPNRTQEANVVIPFAEPLGVDLTIVNAPAAVEQGETFDTVVELENRNVVTPVGRDLTVELRENDTVRVGSTSVTVPEGETRNVTVSSAVPADRTTGEQTLAALTAVAGESARQAITVEAPSSTDLQSRFDRSEAGTEGEIEFAELTAVIEAFNGGDPDVTFDDVSAVIAAFNGDGQWASVGP